MSKHLVLIAAIAAAGIVMETKIASAQGAATERAEATKKAKVHKVAIQVNDNDPRVMNLALNNAANIVEYYKQRGEAVQIEVVTYGPGLHMLRSDSSPVKSRVAQMSLEIPQLTFAACANTQGNMSRQEGKDVPIVSEARVVPSGVVRLMELQQDGFAYIRP